MDPRTAADLVLASAAVTYALASALYFMQLAGKETLVRAAKPLLGLSALLHFAHFFLISFVQRACPVEGIHQATSLTALVAAGLFLLISRFWRVEVVGAFIAPVALAALLAARFIGAPDPAPKVGNTILPIHVTAILLASALFAIASALAATYLLQEKQLKRKRSVGLLQRLPPLDVLDRASYRFLLAGFPLLTIGILTGLLWIGKIQTGEIALLRQVLSFAAWLVFAMVLLMRSAGGWRGRRAAWGTILGFGCAVLVFLVYLVRNAKGGGVG
ncbi:MAG: hypothetical protein NVS3B20_07680 [Polyangiales bacterium]